MRYPPFLFKPSQILQRPCHGSTWLYQSNPLCHIPLLCAVTYCIAFLIILWIVTFATLCPLPINHSYMN